MQGNCSDPHATRALQLLPPEPAHAPFLPLRPFQCLLLVPHVDTVLLQTRDSLWSDNLYLRLHPDAGSQSLPLLTSKSMPTFIRVRTSRTDPHLPTDYATVSDETDRPELHATALTIQGHNQLSWRAVHAVGSTTNPAVFLHGTYVIYFCI